MDCTYRAGAGAVEIVGLCIRGGQPVRAWHQTDGQRQSIAPGGQDASREFNRLVEAYPHAYIAWFDYRIEPFLSDIATWPDLVRHPLEILHLSCFQRCDRMVESLGLVDFDSPFLLPGSTDRRYPTWLISPMGGVGLTSAFRSMGLNPDFNDFSASLFDLGHRGFQQGLCPYSEPRLLQAEIPAEILGQLHEPLSNARLALFIRRRYGMKWLLFWAVGCGLCRQSWPWMEVLKASLKQSSCFGDARLLDSLRPQLSPEVSHRASIDVIVPTLGRPEHVKNLLKDLAKQTLLPKKVVVIEQDPDGLAESLVPEDLDKALPFEVDRHVVRWVGACRARNLGIEKSAADWVLLLDDDVRLTPGLLAYLLEVAAAYHVDAVNAATYLPDQKPDSQAARVFPTVWSSCGGTLLIGRGILQAAGGFDERMEGGYGEDFEFGVRVRLSGGNILHAPAEPILHLKAPSGGFRQPFRHPWANENPQPRPSPIFLYSRVKHSSEAMQQGYRLYHWLKRIASTPIYKWAWEIRTIKRQWRSAVGWAGWLASQNQV